MVTPVASSQKYFPLPGYTGNVVAHGGPQFTGGSDIMAPVGTPVVAVSGGTVTFRCTASQCPSTGGNSFTIKAPDGLEYYYAHLQSAPPAQGSTIQAGQQIGNVGMTGNASTLPASSSHLHIGIGYGISEGTGAPGGLGQNFNAVNLLNSLLHDKTANNPDVLQTGFQPGATPGTVNYVPTVPGFTQANDPWIRSAIASAQKYGVDILTFLGILAQESAFNPDARNPESGACGPAQLDPCQPGLTTAQNIDAGAKDLKAKLDACHGDYHCALNNYSGGGGQSYIDKVTNYAKQIGSANPNIGNAGVDASGSTGGGTSGLQDCQQVDFGPWKIPDLGCVLFNALTQFRLQVVAAWRGFWTGWIQSTEVNKMGDWIFVGVGAVLVYVGVNQMLAHDNGIGRAGTVAKGVAGGIGGVASAPIQAGTALAVL